MKRIYRLPVSFFFALFPFFILFFASKAGAQVQTSTVLQVSPACLTEGCVVTLTATVTANGSPVHPGLVTFCDKGPQNCENEAPVGTAQLIANGTATVRVGLAAGPHSLRAIFHGTKNYAGSTSTSHNVTDTAGAANRMVTSYPPTSAATAGGFQFTTNSLTFMGTAPPTGNVSFLDTSQNNLNLGSAPIVAGPVSQSFTSTNGSYGAETFAQALVPGDFNNDGFQDAVDLDQQGKLNVGLGDGKGNFTLGPAFADAQTGVVAPSGSLPILAADFNSDGILDIALPDPTSNLVRVLLGKGDGTFTLANPTSVTQSAQLLLAGDFNDDGIPDLLVVSTRAQTGSYFQVLMGNGDGTFTAQTAIALTNENLVWAAVGDFNRDGSQDIAFGYYSGANVNFAPADTLAILKGNGNGTFAATPVASIPQSLTILATGDFDGDGIPDIMTGGVNNNNSLEPGVITFYRGNGDFTFSNTAISTVQTPQAFIPGDYLGNGTLQVAASLTGFVNVISGSAMNGPVLDAVPVNNSGGSFGAPAFADFNNDGLPDLVNVYYDFQLDSYYPPAVFSNSFAGTGTATSPVVDLPIGGHQIVASYPGDINHDANLSPPVYVYSSGVAYGSGFGTAPALTLNGSATLNNGAIQLTSGGEFQVGTFFTNSRISFSTDSVVSNFDFQIPVGNADGFAYVIQDNGPNATGSSGGGLGYGNPPGGTGASIVNSLALAFDTHNNQGEGANSIRVEYNGVTSPAGSVDLTASGIDLHSGHRFHVEAAIFVSTFDYLYVVITDTQTHASFQYEFTLQQSGNVISGGEGYIGFTSSTGTSTVGTTIYDWTIDQGQGAGGAFPNGFAGAASGSLFLNRGSAIVGNVLELTSGTSFEATSAYSAQTIPTNFSGAWVPIYSDFDFNVGDGNGDGFTFVLQDHSATAVGSTGGGLGYGVDYLTPAPPPYAIIPNSLAIKFDLHNNHGEGPNSTGIYLNGASPTTPSVDLTSSGINLHSGHTFHARIARVAQDQFTLTITDLNVYRVFQTTFTASNASVLQGGSVYVGFTAGTGATADTIKILNWTFTSAN